MAADGEMLTSAQMLGAVTEAFERSGFERFETGSLEGWQALNARVFEDQYSIAAVATFDTWAELSARWLDVQAALAELISDHIGRAEAKAWEGYVVLLTPSVLSADATLEAERIRRDTTHVRKLVGTGEELRRVEDVDGVLIPLLPIQPGLVQTETRAPFDQLPNLLERHGVPLDAAEELIRAFVEQEPLVERLHSTANPVEPT